jgi:hypothetical protein
MGITWVDNVGKLCGFWYNGRFRTGRVEKVRTWYGVNQLVTVELSNRQEGESTHKCFWDNKMISPAVYA